MDRKGLVHPYLQDPCGKFQEPPPSVSHRVTEDGITHRGKHEVLLHIAGMNYALCFSTEKTTFLLVLHVHHANFDPET